MPMVPQPFRPQSSAPSWPPWLRLASNDLIQDNMTQVDTMGLVMPDVDLDTPAIKPCATVDDPFTSDLTWLMHRAVGVLSDDFDAACREYGLRDMRDTLVLAVAGDGIARTQIEIATTLGLDKSTLVAIIDRLETQGLLMRKADPANRRVRIPSTTPQGQDVLASALAARDRAVSRTLRTLDEGDVSRLRTLLWTIATAD